MILFWSLLALAAVLLYIGYPLVARARHEGGVEATAEEDAALAGQRERLLAERESVLTALSDLEFDHQMGDIVEEDYEPLRHAQRRKAVAILRELESAGSFEPAEETPPPDQYLEDEIARARRRLRRTDGAAEAGKDGPS